MSASKDPSCTQCGTMACKFRPGEKKPPSFCPASSHEELLADVRRIYESNPEVRKLALMAARTEALLGIAISTGFKNGPLAWSARVFARPSQN